MKDKAEKVTKAEKVEYRAALARGGSSLLSPRERVAAEKFNADQERDDHGRWTSSGAAQDAAAAITTAITNDPSMWGSRNLADMAAGRLGTAMHDLATAGSGATREHALRGLASIMTTLPANDMHPNNLAMSHGDRIARALASIQNLSGSERTVNGHNEQQIRDKGGIFTGAHGQNFVTTETLEVMQRQYGTSTFGKPLVDIANAVIAENKDRLPPARDGGATPFRPASTHDDLADYYHSTKATKAEREAFRAALARGGSSLTTPHEQALAQKYSDAQERDDHGRWTSGGGSAPGDFRVGETVRDAASGLEGRVIAGNPHSTGAAPATGGRQEFVAVRFPNETNYLKPHELERQTVAGEGVNEHGQPSGSDGSGEHIGGPQ